MLDYSERKPITRSTKKIYDKNNITSTNDTIDQDITLKNKRNTVHTRNMRPTDHEQRKVERNSDYN